MQPALRVHHFFSRSRANGPGVRAVIWVQGCSLGCPGCYNPETHAFGGGELVPVDELFQRITGLAQTIEGLTVSGGEPLQQRPALLALLRRVRQETSLSVLVFTGFTWEEVARIQDCQALLTNIDVLITGRYEQSQRLAQDMRGSANKTVHLISDRYTVPSLCTVPTTELIITPTGDIELSGIDPLACWNPFPSKPSL